MKNKMAIFVIVLCILILNKNYINNNEKAEAKNSSNNSNNEFSIKDFFQVDNRTKLNADELPLNQFASKDLSIQTIEKGPKILIFHTHSQESYFKSEPNNPSKTVVEVGRELKKQLEENYDISVLHCKEKFDVVDGKIAREKSYKRMEPVIKNILKENPSIEVLIDIHRDAVPPDYKDGVVMIKDKPTAKIIFINGICKKIVDGKILPVEDLHNPYIKENLNLSFQMKLNADELYADYIKKIHIHPYRYGLHMAPKSLSIEIGNNRNTFEEAKNSVEPLAEVLANVLGIKKKLHKEFNNIPLKIRAPYTLERLRVTVK
ncbi:MAG: stage II sporulation protein P [Vallitalea sp.]|jgi:stage II sporulation protein P|nr:stage II sporulation protein P [Vallitalea sp.]